MLLIIKLILAWVVPDTPRWVVTTQAFEAYVHGLASGKTGLKGIADVAQVRARGLVP